MWVVTSKEMKRIDEETYRRYGISAAVLMERAGLESAQWLSRRYGSRIQEGGKILVLAGKGNNGGDGAVIARELHRKGAEVEVILVGQLSSLSGLPKQQFCSLAELGVPVKEFRSAKDLLWLKDRLKQSALVIDALLGIGISSQVRSPMHECIEAVNEAHGKFPIPVISIDLPSGMEADLGTPCGVVVSADATLTMGLPKIGLLTTPGMDFAGEVVVIDIGIPQELVAAQRAAGKIHHQWLLAEDVAPLIPERSSSLHKGAAGRVLVIGGERGKLGAAAMTSEAALRVGAGLVHLLTASEGAAALDAELREVMVEAMPTSREALRHRMMNHDAIAIGPGLGLSEEAKKIVSWVLEEGSAPLVIDADAINIVAQNPSLLKKAKMPLILTPHPGEMARLSKKSTDEVQTNRIAVASTFSKKHRCTTVLKGHGTVIAHPEGLIQINSTGGPNLATAGTGDVLTGTIAGLIAQGASPEHAAALGVFIHGYAADLKAAELGDRGLLATDLLPMLPKALRFLSSRI